MKLAAIISTLAGSAIAANTCDAETNQVCDQAYVDLCIDAATRCNNEAQCMLDIEEFYQEALQSIYETAPSGCACEMPSCIEWDQVEAAGDTELTADEQTELTYLTALHEKLDTLGQQLEAGNFDEAELQGSNSLVLLLLLKKKNHTPIKTLLVLKKVMSSDANGVVKLLVFKKLFGNSHTLLKLDLLGVIGDSSDSSAQSLENLQGASLTKLLLLKKIFGSSTLKKLLLLKKIF